MTTRTLCRRAPRPCRRRSAPAPPRLGLAVVAALAYLVGVPLLLADQPYWLNVLTNASMLSLASLGVWVTFAIGRINIAQGAFAHDRRLHDRHPRRPATASPFWLCLPLSGAGRRPPSAPLIGLPILRLRGVYFAMITLSLTEAVRLAFLNGGDLTKGATRHRQHPAARRHRQRRSPSMSSRPSCSLLGLLAVWRLATSRLGWVFRSLRQNEELAASIGIDIARYRVIAFAFCCAMGGIAGAFFAAFQQNIYPASYTVQDSVNFMLYCFLGGLDFVLGPVVGAFLLSIWLRAAGRAPAVPGAALRRA